MRLLVRSEQEAFRLTVAVVFAGGISVLVGYLFGALAGVALFRARAQLSIPVRRLVIDRRR